MLGKILISLGLRKAPSPFRAYARTAVLVGPLPVAAWLIWKNREKIGNVISKARNGEPKAALALALPSSDTASGEATSAQASTGLHAGGAHAAN